MKKTNPIKVKRNRRIGYFNHRVPKVCVRPPSGQKTKRLSPDTFDVAARAQLALKAMTHQLIAHDYDYEFYFLTNLKTRPAYMRLGQDSVNCHYKYQESSALLRLMTGSTENLEADIRWKETSLQRLGPDGLAYWPLEGRIYEHPSAAWTEPLHGERQAGQVCQPGFMGRLIAAMTLYYLEDKNPIWFQSIEKMISRVYEIALTYEDDSLALPVGGLAPGAKAPDKPEKPTNFWASHQSWLIQGLAQYYKVSHSDKALDLAEKLARYLIRHSEIYGKKGEFIGFDHFHHHSQGTLAVAELALITGKKEYIRFVKGGYDFGKSIGDTLVGFFPEGIRDKDGKYSFAGRDTQTAETCEIADMIALGIKLGQLGFDRCWDDVDQWIRNQFAENQMLKTDWIERRQQILGENPSPQLLPCDTTDCVAERHLGAFVGWPLPNDAVWFEMENGWAFQHCCTANGSRALFYIWNHILHHQDKTLKIHLLLNRSSQWADIDSHIPYTGQVDIHMKVSSSLQIRIPSWVKPRQVRLLINGKPRKPSFKGRYACTPMLKKSDSVTMLFPIEERTVQTTIGGKPFTLVLKGNEVVLQDPPGRWAPFYQRDHYRENQTRWVERSSFSPKNEIQW